MTPAVHDATLPIGVFDSGVGGLTVLAALGDALPDETFVYLGDTARLPYGTKSASTIVRYAEQAARVLVDRGIKLLVVACNTASAVALDALRAAMPGLPIVGVVEPGARAAVAASRTGHIAVIGTEGTIRGGAYTRAIAGVRPDATVRGLPCPLFVALAEEGWCDGAIPEAVARQYLVPWVGDADVLVLGCTHFPLLTGAIGRALGPTIAIVDSAATTAREVAAVLGVPRRDSPARASASPDTTRDPMAHARRYTMLATDGRERFARVGATFLGLPLSPDSVEIVDL
jgi:glutamate racemase